MHRENGLCELGEVADRQAEHAHQEGQQQPVCPAPGTAGEPPDQNDVGADLQRDQQLVAEGGNPQYVPEVLNEAVSAFLLP